MTTSQERSLLAIVIFVSLVVGFVAALVVTGQTPVQRNHGDVVVEEDGSGTQYHGDLEVRTFPEGTFVWDCATMGNRRCG